MVMSYATVHTTLAGEYLIGLCRTWHRALPESDEALTQVVIPFVNGRVALAAGTDRLEIVLTAGTTRDAALLEDLVSDHLDRLSGGEELRYQWITSNEESAAASRRIFNSV